MIDEVEPGERLVFRWRMQGSDRPFTRVAITLTDVPEGGTRLVLVEEGPLPSPTTSATRWSPATPRDGPRSSRSLRALVESPDRSLTQG